MKTTTDNHIDKLLYEAMKQRAAKVPPLADDFAEKVMKKSTSLPLSPSKGRGTQSRFSSLSIWRGRGVRLVGAVAASIIVAFFLWPNSPAVVEQPVVAEVVEQPAPEAPKASDYSEYSEYSDNSEKSEPAESINPQRTHKVCKPQDDPVLAEAEPVIPADKQALVDIYLAEEALQVAYELQVQQEELHAYAASLTGEEEEPQPQPIIAF